MSSNSTDFRVVERKLYPNREQEAKFEAFRVECCRIYNRALEQRIKAYKRRKDSVSYIDQQNLLTKQRQRMDSVHDVPIWFARDALRRVDRAFKAFFRRCREKSEKKGFPRFKKNHHYRSMQFHVPRKFFGPGCVIVPGIGKVRSRGPDAGDKQKLLRIVKRADAWYAQVLIEVPTETPLTVQSSVGIDVGLNAFATLSTGEKIENPRWYRRSQRLLRTANKSLARKKKCSKNRIKARVRLAKVHQKIAAQRKDFCHQESRKIVNRFGLIGVEKLRISWMVHGNLAKSILDAAWGMFLFFLTYKAASARGQAIAVDPRLTSQECPWCGAIKKKSLSERVHQCECKPGIIIDRDEAAALVIQARAEVIAAALLWRELPLFANLCPQISKPCEARSP